MDVTGLRFGAFYNSKLFFLNSLNFLSVKIIIVDLHQELRGEFVMAASELVKLVWIAGFVSSGRFDWDFWFFLLWRLFVLIETCLFDCGSFARRLGWFWRNWGFRANCRGFWESFHWIWLCRKGVHPLSGRFWLCVWAGSGRLGLLRNKETFFIFHFPHTFLFFFLPSFLFFSSFCISNLLLFAFLKKTFSFNIVPIFLEFFLLLLLIIFLHKFLTLIILMSSVIFLHHISPTNMTLHRFRPTPLHMLLKQRLFKTLLAVRTCLWLLRTHILMYLQFWLVKHLGTELALFLRMGFCFMLFHGFFLHHLSALLALSQVSEAVSFVDESFGLGDGLLTWVMGAYQFEQIWVGSSSI